ncbi:DUF3080 family protein [Modicisalibacter tunisiensis]|uniref:DUF3080 family protein n=1 Tax=Modicisalibacter tunisiensis TaxID=390637 RepID=UPI001CCCD70A|nr:DUF3080 family protein [Modicisalibacter tunisiensis]
MGTELRRAWRRPGSVLVGLLIMALSGCGDPAAEQRLAAWQAGLAQALEVPSPATLSPPNIGAFPERDARLFPIAETREGLLDVYALRRCDIVKLVARRNSQLGKVAPASQRWLYELTLWRRLQACWNGPAAQALAAEDRQRLGRLLERKTRQLPRAGWNALFDAEEWVGTFSRASSPLPPDADLRDALAALAYLRRMVVHQFDPRWTPTSAHLEGHLKALRQAPYTAEVLRGLLLATRRLEDLDRQLARAACSPDNAAALNAALTSPAVRRGQAYLDRLAEQGRHWLTAVNALLDAYPVTRPAIARYRRRWLSLDALAAPWPRFRDALERHAARIATLRRDCATPGASGTLTADGA